MNAEEQQLLNSIGARGWMITSRFQDTDVRSINEPGVGPVQKAVPLETWSWVITDGQGHNATIHVRPTTGGTGKGGVGYEIAGPVPNIPQPAAETARPAPFDQWKPITDSNGRQGRQDPNTGSVYWNQPADANQPSLQLKQSPDGTFYAWDPVQGTVTQTGMDAGAAAQFAMDQAKSQAAITASQASANASNVSAQATLLRSQIDAAQAQADRELDPLRKQQLEAQIASAKAQLANIEAQTTQTQQQTALEAQKANRPTVVEAPATQPKIAVQNADGTVTWLDNQNYQPQEIGQRIAQLQQTAATRKDELVKAVNDGTLTAAEAQQQFLDWWDQTIEPQRQQIQAAQQQQQADESTKRAQSAAGIANAGANLQNVAQTAGNQAVDAVLRTLPYQVGPNWATEYNKILSYKGGGPLNLDASAFQFPAPDLNAIAQQATARALAGMSPYAANLAGVQLPQASTPIDVQGLLNRQTYAGQVATAMPRQVATPTAIAPTAIAPRPALGSSLPGSSWGLPSYSFVG